MSERPYLSIVVPVFRSASTLRALVDRLRACAEPFGRFEIVFVDDGSPDGSWEIVRELAESFSEVRGLRFTRNFGHHLAITAGLDAARATDWIAYLDADLDEPPEAIADLLQKAGEGYEVAILKRPLRKKGGFGKLTSALFYRLLSKLADTRLDPTVGNIRVISRKCLDTLCGMREQHRFLGTMFEWMGYRTAFVEHGAAATARESGYTLRKRLRLAESAVLSNSSAPLRIAAKIGFVFMAVSILSAIGLSICRIIYGASVPGWTGIMVGLGMIGGLIIFQLGIIGVYLAVVVESMRGRPLYVVGDMVGNDDPLE
jgi:glycosyltransferase involved in cell wall biosynthesis